jgi:hypothetical protein
MLHRKFGKIGIFRRSSARGRKKDKPTLCDGNMAKLDEKITSHCKSAIRPLICSSFCHTNVTINLWQEKSD